LTVGHEGPLRAKILEAYGVSFRDFGFNETFDFPLNLKL
jgi:hypothetical protein